MENHLTIRLPKRLLKVALILTVVGAVIAPIAVSASHQFTDVPTDNIFHDNIGWLADNDVTKGCNPPANDQFCPDANVTRGQMAAFMQRLSEGKIVDAATAVTAESATTADSATTAGDADTVDGMHASDLASEVSLFEDTSFVALVAGDTTEILSLELEPGSYLITTIGVLNSNAVDGESVSCTLAAGTTSVSTEQFVLFGGTGPGDRESISIMAAVTLDATANATLSCTASGAFTGNVVDPQLAAISVQSASAAVAASATSAASADSEG